MNARAPRCEAARPREISHIAIGADDPGEAVSSYIERLGFIVSDRYVNRGIFMRCAPVGQHHHVFFTNVRQPGARFNHLAFKVGDTHELIGGGQHRDALGGKTFAGSGRHLISSACFWYFVSPFGGAWVYAVDEDMVDEAGAPRTSTPCRTSSRNGAPAWRNPMAPCAGRFRPARNRRAEPALAERRP